MTKKNEINKMEKKANVFNQFLFEVNFVVYVLMNDTDNNLCYYKIHEKFKEHLIKFINLHAVIQYKRCIREGIVIL